MRRVLIWLSGAHREVLDLAPSERPKYEGIGGVVLTTAVMAAFSCAFALHFALKTPLIFYIPLGVLWGLAIMNLDRWLISAAPRRDAWYKNLAQTLPRLIVALLIGTVVSTPLVMRVFDPEITAQLEVMQQRDQKAYDTKQAAQKAEVQRLLDRSDYLSAARTATKGSAVVDQFPAVRQAKAALVVAQKNRDTARTQYNKELSRGTVSAGTESTLNDAEGKLAGRERNYNNARQAAVPALRSDGNENYEQAKRDYDEALKRYNASSAQFADSNEDRTGLLARLEALAEVTAKNPTLQRAYVILLLFITMIEILPVLVKFMMTLGEPNSYERALVKFEKAKLREADLTMEDREKATDLAFQSRARRREDETQMEEELDRVRREQRRDEAMERETTRRRRNSTYDRI